MQGDPGGQGAGAGRVRLCSAWDRPLGQPPLALVVLPAASHRQSAYRGWKGTGSHFWSWTQGKRPGCLAPTIRTSCGSRGAGWEDARAAGWHLGCRGRAGSAGTREQRGSWEQNRNVRVTQRFLARGAASGSRAQRERGGQAGRDPLEESGQSTMGLRNGDEGPGNTRQKWCWGVTGGRPGGGQATERKQVQEQ